MNTGTIEKVMLTDPTGKIHLHSMNDPVVGQVLSNTDLLLMDFNDKLFLICANEDVARVGTEFFLFGRALISGLDEKNLPVGVTDKDINDTILEMTERLTTARIGSFCFPVIHLTSLEELKNAGRS